MLSRGACQRIQPRLANDGKFEAVTSELVRAQSPKAIA